MHDVRSNSPDLKSNRRTPHTYNPNAYQDNGVSSHDVNVIDMSRSLVCQLSLCISFSA